MEIKTKYNVNDKIVVKDNDNKILTTVKRIEIYATDANLGIKYITEYGTVYENDVIDKNDFLNELNNVNNENKTNPIEVITMTFRTFDEPVKSKYNIGQLVEYYYKGDKYISVIENININDKNITYKLIHDHRNLLETEIKAIKFDIDDDLIYFIHDEENGKLKFLKGRVANIYNDCIVVRTDGYLVDIQPIQILRRI